MVFLASEREFFYLFLFHSRLLMGDSVIVASSLPRFNVKAPQGAFKTTVYMVFLMWRMEEEVCWSF